MKVVLGVPWYLPESIGGTEIFVHTLSAQLDKLGVDCAIMTPSMDGKTSVSSYSGIRVVRFPAMTVKDTTRYGILASQHSDAFTRLLEAESPDIYNQHEWSQNLGFSAFRVAKALKIPTIFTIHMGLIICRIQTLLYRNKVQCDGEIIENRCTNCLLETRGVPAQFARVITQIPPKALSRLSKLPRIGPLFSGRDSVRDIALGLHSVAGAVDRIVTVSQWLNDALSRNGVSANKILCIRPGVDPEIVASAPVAETQLVSERPANPTLRIGFLGRANRAKGLHVLAAALLRMPQSASFNLKALVIAEEAQYLAELERDISDRFAFTILLNQPRSAVREFFQTIDVLAVPSQCLESGPLVVLEAHAWKVPVVGSDLGGIRELVRRDVDGLLVAHDDIAAWTRAFVQLAREPERLLGFRENIGVVRTTLETAEDTLSLYKSVLEASGRRTKV